MASQHRSRTPGRRQADGENKPYLGLTVSAWTVIGSVAGVISMVVALMAFYGSGLSTGNGPSPASTGNGQLSRSTREPPSPDQRSVTAQTGSPSPQLRPTLGEVRNALLRSSDLASIDAFFIAKDIQPRSQTCGSTPTRPLVNAARQLTVRITYYPIIAEQINVFSSARSAQSAYTASSSHLGCDSSAAKTDITNEVRGFCDQARAVKYYSPAPKGAPGSYYLAEIRCGRVLVELAVGTRKGLPSDDVSNLFLSVETALPRVRALEQN
jgi:hypothetical protein